MKPLLFLDVDGVINTYAAPPETTRDYPQLGLRVPHGTAQRVHQLTQTFTVVWATSWGKNAHPALRDILSLPDASWPALRWKRSKLRAIRRYAAHTPWAWLDDHPQPAPDGLVIPINPAEGITDQTVRLLEAYAAEQAQAA